MNKLKTLCIAALLLFTVNAALAQDKYEYAVMTYQTNVRDLGISLNGADYKKIEVSRDEVKHPLFDVNPALKEVNKMQVEGWELFNTTSNGLAYTYVFYLRKKVS